MLRPSAQEPGVTYSLLSLAVRFATGESGRALLDYLIEQFPDRPDAYVCSFSAFVSITRVSASPTGGR